jgi:hypothetical protein
MKRLALILILAGCDSGSVVWYPPAIEDLPCHGYCPGVYSDEYLAAHPTPSAKEAAK